MNNITNAQLSKLHVLLTQLKILDQKPDLVLQFTDYRTMSSKEMTKDEATELIRHLSKYDSCDKMRKKVFALAYEAGIIYGDSWEDKKMNAAKLNLFLQDRGTVKKELGKMSKEELVKTVSQFEQIVKHNEGATASKITKSVLSELNIPVHKKKSI
jgi:hypothetical protein